MLTIERNTLEFGLERPIRLLHITDTHLALCDDRDDARKQALAVRRKGGSADALARLREQTDYALENCDLLVHTGDLIDFVSRANVDFARDWLKNEKVLFIAGNHEYSQYVGEAWEDMTYRMNSYMSMGPGGLGVDLFFTARSLGGVNFVGIDDAYHQVEPWQLERLRAEVEKGLPVVLFMHAPLFEEALYRRSVEFWQDGSAYVVGCDEAHLRSASEFRAMGQRPTEATRQFVDYVNGEARIKAVLAGHLHFNFTCRLPGGAMQYVTATSPSGAAREITLR